MEGNNWYKENDYKIVLKDYLWKKVHNSWHLQLENLPPEIEIDTSKGRENLKGKKFNNIEVLYPCGYNTDKRVMYVCKCFCGNYFLASGKNIKNGTTKSCDCLRNKRVIEANISRTDDIIGKTFGLLTVTEFSHFGKKNDKHSVSFYKCKCSCGRECIKQATYLRCGDTKSCGLCGMNSVGEAEIANILDKKKVKYSAQWTFKDCLSEKGFYLYFDFAIFKEDKLFCLIEYDGEQHYKDIPRFTNYFGDFKERHDRDLIKDKYCKNNNILLYRIRFDEDINERMEEILNEL